MQINIQDLEGVSSITYALTKIDLAHDEVHLAAGSQVILVNSNGYAVGTLIFDGDFWTFSPEGYGKSSD